MAGDEAMFAKRVSDRNSLRHLPAPEGFPLRTLAIELTDAEANLE